MTAARSPLPSPHSRHLPPSIAWLTAAGVGLFLGACLPGPASTPSGAVASGVAASSSGVCLAVAALPDVSAADRAFINVAHAALHQLAAVPRLDRAMAARILETMLTVEADFRVRAAGPVVGADLANLHAAADAALRALGIEVPPCAG